MADRPLSNEEKALWQRLVATVDPLDKRRKPAPIATPIPKTASIAAKATPRARPNPPSTPRTPPPEPITPGNLDGHWDRRMAKGRVEPDVTIDLHGANLDRAYARLDSALELAIASGHRAILLIAGRPRGHDRSSGTGRGAIRAALDDWLAASRHAAHIAAVRPAHPRHGGAGALYIILKRRRISP